MKNAPLAPNSPAILDCRTHLQRHDAHYAAR
jgi:hypothetical protein